MEMASLNVPTQTAGQVAALQTQSANQSALSQAETQELNLRNQDVAFKLDQERAATNAFNAAVKKPSTTPAGPAVAMPTPDLTPRDTPAPQPVVMPQGLSQIGKTVPGGSRAPLTPLQQVSGQKPSAPFMGNIEDHPVAQQLYAAGNTADTNSSTSENPKEADVQQLPNGVVVDRQAFYKSLADSGHAELIPKFQANFLASDQASQLAKNTQAIQSHAQLVGHMAAFDALPDSMKPAAYSKSLADLSAEGVDISRMPATYDSSNPDTVAYIKNLSSQATSALDKIKDKHDTDTSNVDAYKAITERNKSEDKTMSDYERASIGLENAKFNFNKSQAFGGLNGVLPQSIEEVPANIRPTVAGIADNSVRPETVSVRPTNGQPSRAQVLNMVKSIYPGWNENLSAQAAKTIVDAAPTGITGKSLIALSTIADHLTLARQAKDALANGDIPALNSIANKLGQASGSDKQVIYQTIAGVLGGEADKLMSGGNPTLAGSREWESRLGFNASPAQSEGALSTLEAATAGKMHSIDQTYHNASNVHIGDTGLISPAAKSLLQKYPNPTDNTPTNSQTQMAKLGVSKVHTATGANGEKYQLSSSWILVK